jgi:hypothetical protein
MSSHSADVRIRLLLNGSSLSVAQLGPNFIILREAQNHPPCEGEISLTIDGKEKRWPVRLPEGLPANRTRVPIATVQESKTPQSQRAAHHDRSKTTRQLNFERGFFRVRRFECEE